MTDRSVSAPISQQSTLTFLDKIREVALGLNPYLSPLQAYNFVALANTARIAYRQKEDIHYPGFKGAMAPRSAANLAVRAVAAAGFLVAATATATVIVNGIKDAVRINRQLDDLERSVPFMIGDSRVYQLRGMFGTVLLAGFHGTVSERGECRQLYETSATPLNSGGYKEWKPSRPITDQFYRIGPIQCFGLNNN